MIRAPLALRFQGVTDGVGDRLVLARIPDEDIVWHGVSRELEASWPPPAVIRRNAFRHPGPRLVWSLKRGREPCSIRRSWMPCAPPSRAARAAISLIPISRRPPPSPLKTRIADKTPYSGSPACSMRPTAPRRPTSDFAGLEIALVGGPMDLGVTNRPGARFGPRAARAVERSALTITLGPRPARRMPGGRIGDSPCAHATAWILLHRGYLRVLSGSKAAGVRPLSVGGDHSITYPILKALGCDGPVGLVHFEAHCDTGGEFDAPNSITAAHFARRCSMRARP